MFVKSHDITIEWSVKSHDIPSVSLPQGTWYGGWASEIMQLKTVV